jgi:hypothetical protein
LGVCKVENAQNRAFSLSFGLKPHRLLGYFPHISLNDDPVKTKDMMAGKGVSFSQIDAAYPLSGPDGITLGVQYVLKSLQWAKLAGCPNIATTDGRKNGTARRKDPG